MGVTSNLTIGCIITRLGTGDQSSCRCVYMVAGDGRRPLAQVLRNSLSGHPPSTGCETGIPYQMTYTARDVRACTSTGVSAHITTLRLYVRQPDGFRTRPGQAIDRVRGQNRTTWRENKYSINAVIFWVTTR